MTNGKKFVFDALSVIAILVLPASILEMTQHEQIDPARKYMIIVIFIDTVPFMLGVTWLTVRRTKSPVAKRVILTTLSIVDIFVFVVFLYLIVYYQSTEFVVIGFLNAFPCVLSMLWLIYVYHYPLNDTEE